MFFFGGESSILPYLLYLALIWGIFLLNGILDTTVKKEAEKKTSVADSSKTTSPLLTGKTFKYGDHLKTDHTSERDFRQFHEYLPTGFNPQKIRISDLTINLIKNVIRSISFRGPPHSVFTHRS